MVYLESLRRYMKLSIIIVNYNTELHINHLLGDLKKQTLPKKDWQVIVVNNSQNDTLKNTISQFFHDFSLILVQSPQNIGFGRAMNLGSEHATGEHFLIVNPDIRIDNPNFLHELYQNLQKNPDYGVISCKILNEYHIDTAQFTHFEFHERFLVCGTAWFLGAFLVFQKSVYQKLGGFDPDFFMYCEDQDICLRVHKMQLPLIFLDALYVYHKGGASEPTKSYDYFYRMYRSNFLFAYKHFDNQRFWDIIYQWHKKSQYNSIKYALLQIIGITYIAKFKTQQNKWRAIYKITQKVKKEGADCLIFKTK